MVAKYRGYAHYFHILNVYVPYKDIMFLTKTEIPIGICFFASGIMEIATLLMAGDLNCILGPDEV